MYNIRMWGLVGLMVFFSTAAFAEKRIQQAWNMRTYLTDEGKIQTIDYQRDVTDIEEYIKYGNSQSYKSDIESGAEYLQMVKYNDIDPYSEIKKWNAIYNFKHFLSHYSYGQDSYLLGLTNTGLLKCVAPNDAISLNPGKTYERTLDSGLLCNGLDGMTGVKDFIIDEISVLWIFKNSGELLQKRPTSKVGNPYGLHDYMVDPELKAALENPSEHIGYFGMIKPLHPEASGSSENLLPMIKSNSDGIAANAASILENNSGISKNSIDILSAAAADSELSGRINTNSDNLASANTAISDNTLQIISNTGRIEAVSTKVDSLETGGIPDTTYTYSAEYVDTGDFQDVVANVRKEHRVNGNIESLSDHLVVLFTNTDEWVHEAIEYGNLKYYTDKSLADFQPTVYSDGDNATVTGWAIRWDVSKAKHKAWEYMRDYKRKGDLEKSNAQRKVSALVFVKKPVE